MGAMIIKDATLMYIKFKSLIFIYSVYHYKLVFIVILFIGILWISVSEQKKTYYSSDLLFKKRYNNSLSVLKRFENTFKISSS